MIRRIYLIAFLAALAGCLGTSQGQARTPGICQDDQGCPGGQVCEDCGAGKCCISGCRSDDQCPSGRKCRSVQCIRAPCPAQCSP